MDMPLIANILGFSSLITYSLTLLPTIVKIVFSPLKRNSIVQSLLQHRRLIGILAFFLALGHGLLLIQKRNLDFFDVKTYWIYFQGISIMVIFTILAITSNDWSVRKLKKNWKNLHKLTYFGIFILNWHVLEKMSGHWTYLTPASILIINTMTILTVIRFSFEKFKKKQKNNLKLIQIKSPEKTAL